MTLKAYIDERKYEQLMALSKTQTEREKHIMTARQLGYDIPDDVIAEYSFAISSGKVSLEELDEMVAGEGLFTF